MARAARATCPGCGRTVSPESLESSRLFPALARSRDAACLSPSPFPRRPGRPAKRLPPSHPPRSISSNFLREQGYLRVWIGGSVHRTDEAPAPDTLPAVVAVIQDRMEIGEAERGRLTEAVETALRLGKGKITLVEPETGESFPHSSGWHCPHCDRDIRPPAPGLFSFNNPLGACPDCRGFGRVIGIDYDRVMPDRSLSIAGGVVKPFQSGQSRECQRDLLKACAAHDIDVHLPFEDLPESDRKFVIEGETGADLTAEELWENDRWYGVDGFFRWMERKTYKMHIRVFLSRYRAYKPCGTCGGGRFQPETLNYRPPCPRVP